MDNGIFKFKKFNVFHSKSSMKVGVDGVLIGAWANDKGKKILDVGTGCGLIALMLAQRNGEALIDAIDIDEKSVDEAGLNFENSMWSERLRCMKADFRDWCKDNKLKYDLIVSNPPYYSSGVVPSGRRMTARHQGALSPWVIIEESEKILNENGRIAMIMPNEIFNQLSRNINHTPFRIDRICKVRRSIDHPYKRIMIELTKSNSSSVTIEYLTMFDKSGEPTDAYRELCKDFYLKF